MSRRTDVLQGKRGRIAILTILTLVIALLHFLIPTESHSLHKLHIVVRKLYFLPPVMAAAWFGLGGAIWTTLAVSGLFMLHAMLDWPGNYMEQANQIGELIGFWVAGLIPGYLFDRQRTLLVELAAANEETLHAFVSALDLREHNTCMHSQRVREYTLLLADRLGTGEKQRRDIAYGALLHDIGKIAVPDQILLKPAGLSDSERQEMRKHPEAGYRIVRQAPFLRDAAEIVYAHHERFDGCGYPRGLKGAAIPLGARLFMVADVYDAITSERPYRSPMSHHEAVNVIRDESGGHFDPAAVAAFEAIRPEQWQDVSRRYRDGVHGSAVSSTASASSIA